MSQHTASAGQPGHTSLALALVSMPFVSAWRPSIQLGTLAPVARAAGYRTSTYHLFLDFAALIGPERYEVLCDFGRQPVGDWLFSVAAFGEEAPDPTGERLVGHEATQRLLYGLGWPRERLLEVRHELVPQYLDWLEGLVPWEEFDVVGFTSTFQQNGASLALARRVKSNRPETTIVFGGANLDGEMGLELLRVAPWVDYAVAGEAEETLPELLAAIKEGRSGTGVRGVAGRLSGRLHPAVQRPLSMALDTLPVPDYDEYFERARTLRVLELMPYDVRLPFESSRGCWWGEKHHCTFCGLNGTAMTYRAKSAGRSLHELATLSAHHGVTRFDAVDNILDRQYLNTLLPELARAQAPYRLFFEVKANLDEPEVDLLAAAGVEEIQPGIESLSSPVLALMDKGVTAAQNVELLRRCTARGIEVRWNVLYGFPGETADDYAAQVALMRRLHHLPPPESVGRIWMERFSPLFADRDRFGVRELTPQQGYEAIYPERTNLSRIAYFFDYTMEDGLPDESFDALHHEVTAWQQEWAAGPPTLSAVATETTVEITDTRWGAPVSHELVGPHAAVFLMLQSRRRTLSALGKGSGLDATALHKTLESLTAHHLIADDGKFLFSLPVCASGSGADPASDREEAVDLQVGV